MKRVGIIALLHESNTFIDQPTTLDDFRSNVLVRGNDTLTAFRGSNHEVGGFIQEIESTEGFEPVGIFAARATPYGAIEAACWNALMKSLDQCMEMAGPIDGLLVAPHGATVAENAADADGAWLRRVREYYGASLPIVGTLDLHANVSHAMVDACDALYGYRTNPHLDQKERGLQAAFTLVRTLRNEVAPKQFLVQLPCVINIERQATEEAHGKALWKEVRRMQEADPHLIGLSLLYGFPYADVHEMGASVIAVADEHRERAVEAGCQMARFWWNRREDFVGRLTSIDSAIEQAMTLAPTEPTGPVGLLDMGDNVGGGSPGDGTWIAHAWRKQHGGPLLTILVDQEAVQTAMRVGIGASVLLSIGGKADPTRHGPPIEGEFRVTRITDGQFSESKPRHGGYSHFDQGLTAVFQSEDGLAIIAISRRVAPLSLQQVLAQGLNPSDFTAIILKGVHAPVAAYEPVCRQLIRVNTDGVTTADLSRLRFTNRRVPMYPWEDAHWSEGSN